MPADENIIVSRVKVDLPLLILSKMDFIQLAIIYNFLVRQIGPTHKVYYHSGLSYIELSHVEQI